MSFRVTVKPTNDVCEAEPRETVLQAGLRAGLNLNHNCDNGSCGSCRARLLAGEVAAVGYQDYQLTEAEKATGHFLMCRHRPMSDVVIEARQVGSVTEIPAQSIQAKVTKVERLQDGVILLQIRTPRSRGLQFLAGQGVALCFDGLRPRVLPIASCPCDALHLRFHVRYRPGDAFCEFVFNALKKGAEVVLEGPVGDFTLNEESRRPLLLIAWEGGFAPIESLIDHAIQLDPDRTMHLYWLSAIPGGHYLSNYCRAWVDALDDFHYHSIDLAPAGEWDVMDICREIQRRHRPLADWDYYLALPEELSDSVCRFAASAGGAQHQVRVTLLPHC